MRPFPTQGGRTLEANIESLARNVAAVAAVGEFVSELHAGDIEDTEAGRSSGLKVTVNLYFSDHFRTI